MINKYGSATLNITILKILNLLDWKSNLVASLKPEKIQSNI
jgi:hypothetical protein